MAISIYDLSYGYLKGYSGEEVTDRLITESMTFIKQLLSAGWSSDEIIYMMKLENDWTLQEFKHSFKGKKPKDKNLLKPDEYYWHPQLRCTPGAPKRAIDYDTGMITKIEEPHFLEMRASYTLDDLYWYYIAQHSEPETQGEVNKWKGALRYLLSQYSIDTILFMIDASANFIRAEDYQPFSSPLDMADYVREAQRMMGEKITEERMAGDEGIVPKRRVPLSRGRSEITERTLQAESYA